MKEFLANTLLKTYRWQPHGRLLRLQKKQFSKQRAKTQWWYYDFFSESGFTGVLAFIPNKWWPDANPTDINEACIMLSFQQPDGTTERYTESVESNLLKTTSCKLSLGDYLTIDYQISNGLSRHKLSFDLHDIKGNLTITANTRAFSPLPLGTLSPLGRRLLYRSNWCHSSFRYVSQIPRGEAKGHISTPNGDTDFSGYAYHEQGWFNNEPHLLNSGWYWFHFLHPKCNIFGLPGGYIFVQLNDETLLGGVLLPPNHYQMKTRKHENAKSYKILTGGEINVKTADIEVAINLDSSSNHDLIEFESSETGQLWNTSIVKADCTISAHKKTHHFSGNAMVETCWLQK